MLVSKLAGMFRSQARSRELDRFRERGDRARDAKDWSEAEAAYLAFVDLAPKDFGIWVQVGHMRKERGRLAEAAEAYEVARRLRPDDADLFLQLGHLAKLRDDPEGAKAHYARSYALDQNAPAEREFVRLVSPTAGEDDASHEPNPVGFVDSARDGHVLGWAFDPGEDGRPAVIDFVTETGQRVGTATAHLERPDIGGSGLPTRAVGFEAHLSVDVPSGTVARVHARFKRTGRELSGSPFDIVGGRGGGRHHPPVTDTRFVIAKPLVRRAGAETAMVVTLSTDGVVRPHVLPLLRELDAAGITIVLIVVATRPVLVGEEVAALSAGILVRDNAGFDFAAWAHALLLFPEVWDSSILYFVNDSIFGPRKGDAFASMIERIRADPADLVALTETHEFQWHLQSYFMAAKKRLLGSFVLHLFFRGVEVLRSKEEVIRAYEIPLASFVLRTGYQAKALFGSDEPRNPTMHGWRALMASGFPFVKLLLFRERFADIDMSGWRDLLPAAGFDVPLLEATLKHKGVTGPVEAGFPLLAQHTTMEAAKAGRLKVAFYGPWNYENGLGFASRAMVAALRGPDLSLNLHPIKKPFHIHRALVPSLDSIDFEGPADVAIVHLNPDAWSLLTPEQLAAIRGARKRVGYWVWEMGHIPTSWKEHYFDVDRIWTPSRYCADVFTAYAEIPVDVVPHPVPLAPADSGDAGAAAIRAELGLPASSRLVLFIFDGSSYLVRKNPAALIRAFAASGLGVAGWSLVLKTKNLYDRRADGMALEALARDVPGVFLIDRGLSAIAMTSLMAAASIYASPHCSEGFGLTIAEAMAAGKSVVATDFGGSRDFLDPTCGYPVPGRPTVLTEDFGHYTAGGAWASIDEDKLARTLVDAARAIEAGDSSRGDAARARVAASLSYAAVGAAARASLEDLFADHRPVADAPDIVNGRKRFGIPVRDAALGDEIVVVLLADDGFRCLEADVLEKVPDRRDVWAVFAQNSAQLAPAFVTVVKAAAESRPDVAVFYGDDVALHEEGLLRQLDLKPSFDLTLFAAQGFVGAPVIVRGSALHQLGGLQASRGEAALDDLVLRAWDAGLGVERIPEVLLAHGGLRPGVDRDARRAMLQASSAFQRYRIEDGATPQTLRLSRDLPPACPDVTLLVPTRRSRSKEGTVYVERLLDSLAATDWPMQHLKVIVADDIVGEPGWTVGRPYDLRRLETLRAADEPFNFSQKMNGLWRAASSDLVLFLNDDVVVTEPGWLKAMVTFGLDESVGAVGPRLLYDDGTLQHLGIAGGLFGVCAHAWLGRPSSLNSYQDWMLVHREWSMITGAVMMTRRSVLEQVGGFDELFSIEFNDLDLCLRIRTAGYRIVCTPHATMTHSEKASRGDSLPPGAEVARFLSRWQAWLDNDPAFHPRMRRDRFDLQPRPGGAAWYR